LIARIDRVGSVEPAPRCHGSVLPDRSGYPPPILAAFRYPQPFLSVTLRRCRPRRVPVHRRRSHAGVANWLTVSDANSLGPAPSAPGSVPPAPMFARPRRMRVVAIVLAAVVVVVFTLIGVALHGKTDGGVGVFQAGDQFAMVGLGVLIALGILAFARPKVAADRRGIRIRNIVGGYDLPWGVVRGVRYGRGSAWAALELQDDEMVSIHAIQANDKEYAVGAVRALRALHAAAMANTAGTED
jgi:PH (Pleckstrin Homology) domain-containing protein